MSSEKCKIFKSSTTHYCVILVVNMKNYVRNKTEVETEYDKRLFAKPKDVYDIDEFFTTF